MTSGEVLHTLPEAGGVEKLWWLTAAMLLALLLATSVLALFDARTIEGNSVWAKPMKFQLSLALHFATLALVVRGLSEDARTGTLLAVAAVAAVASTAFEVGYIMLQAARQQGSHFNLSTPFHAAMYVAMAIGAVLIVAAAAVVGGLAAFDVSGRFSVVMRTGLALGLIGGTLLTLVVAFTMGGRLDHHVGLAAGSGRRMLLTGWSLEVGDLRVPHFFATHMMQAVPLAAACAEAILAPGLAVTFVWLFAAGWSALVLWLFSTALAGLPIGPLTVV